MKPKQVAALVPMRHHSERVPGKNYRPLGGRILYEHILETLQACASVSLVVVDTDSPTISQGIQAAHPEVRLIDRPEALRGGDIPVNQILAYDVAQVPFSFYLQTHCTNPLLRPETIERAIRAFLDEYPVHDSLFSVTKLQKRLWTPSGQPLNHDPSVLLRTQDLPYLFEENSCLYLFEREGFLARGNRLGKTPLLFEIEREEAWDIDEEDDFRIAEALMRDRVLSGQDRQRGRQ